LCGVLAWYNCGIEEFRLGHLGELPEHPLRIFSPPWLALRAYVSRSGDEKLYWQDSRLAKGEEPDLDYLAEKRQGDFTAARAEMATAIRPGAGARLPYRDFPFEYPPLPLAMMLLPRIFVDSLAAYRLAYGILAALVTLLACGLGYAYWRKLAAGRGPSDPWQNMAILVLAIGPILVARIDMLPASLVLGALLLLARKRAFAAGLCLGAGALAKIYPLMLLAPWFALLWVQERRSAAIKLSLGAMLAIAVISAPFLWTAPDAFLHSTFLYCARPFQVESLVGALTALWGGKAFISGSFGSHNVVTPEWLDWLWSVLLPSAVFLCTVCAVRQRRQPVSGEDRAEQLLHWSCAVLCLILLTSKVLSPQFFIWLLPLVAITPSPLVRRWAIVSVAITQLFYPILYDFLIDGSRVVALIVVLRNAALLMMTWHAVRSALGTATEPVSLEEGAAPEREPELEPDLEPEPLGNQPQGAVDL
jgi:hypothetical protein